MKHYPHHISDFNNATRHLTRLERSIYRDLIDLYYETEHQLTLDVPALCRRILANECSTDVERVLNEFFTKTPKGWYHDRCEEEIEAYKSNSSQKALAGKASAEKKRLKKLQALNGDSTSVEQPLNSVETEPQQNSTNHQPSTINQSIEANASVGKPTVPNTPVQQIIDLYNEILPELPAAKLITSKRKRETPKFWLWVMTSSRSDGKRRAETADEGISFIRSYFERAKENDFVMGRTPKAKGHEGWEAGFDYLISEPGRVQVVEKTR